MDMLGASGNRCPATAQRNIAQWRLRGARIGVSCTGHAYCVFISPTYQHMLSTASFDHKGGTSQKLGGLVS